jgi:hypothetical protein
MISLRVKISFGSCLIIYYEYNVDSIYSNRSEILKKIAVSLGNFSHYFSVLE